MPPIPMQVVYIGLVGCLVALIVATATNGWKPKVFFLLLLRLAIGWQFLFEGMHKIHSHMVGLTETNKPFSSESFFKVSPTRLGEIMRKQSGTDPVEIVQARVIPASPMSPAAFAQMSLTDQAGACPAPVSAEFDKLTEVAGKNAVASAEKAVADLKKQIAELTKQRDKAADDKKPDAVKTADELIKKATEVEAKTAALKQKIDANPTLYATALITEAKARYARWVFGVDRRDAKARYFNGDVPQSAPERLAHLTLLKADVAEHESRVSIGLGNGNGIETARLAALKNELLTGYADLAKDADTFAGELKKDLIGSQKVETETVTTQMQFMDRLTMWFIAIVGACILFGLFTRLSCVLAAGFLVMTYLTHPPFPWYVLLPGTEGNPLFVNKNLIECFALLALACMPTGRWLGIDALIYWLFFRKKK